MLPSERNPSLGASAREQELGQEEVEPAVVSEVVPRLVREEQLGHIVDSGQGSRYTLAAIVAAGSQWVAVESR
jgi:hypothetical protein